MIRQIRYFQAVVRNNSFSEAAEECYVSQSAISQQIQALEKELGVELIHRENRRFSLTPAAVVKGLAIVGGSVENADHDIERWVHSK